MMRMKTMEMKDRKMSRVNGAGLREHSLTSVAHVLVMDIHGND